MTTTTDAVYRSLLARVKAQVSALTLHDNAIYVVPRSKLNLDFSVSIQIAPMGAVAQAAIAGHGLVTEEFEVTVWKRVHLDTMGRATTAITDATLGLLNLVRTVRVGLISFRDEALGSDLGLDAVIWIRGGRPQEEPGNEGWFSVTDTFRCMYALSWPAPQNP